MRRLTALVVALGTMTLAACQDVTEPAPQISAPTQQALTGNEGSRHIVVFGPAVADPGAAAEAVASSHGLTPTHVFTNAVGGFSAPIPAGRLAAIERDPRVQRVEPVRVERFVAQQVPTGIDRIETDRNPSADIDQTDDVRVPMDIAIIDSGIDSDHTDLNVGGGRNFANGGADAWDDGNGHGTHVAGTAAALDNGSMVVGVAPGARVWAARVCGNSGFCFTDDIVAGIDWVAGKKADFKAGVSGGIDFAVANMSISTADDANTCSTSSGAVHLAICGLVAEGVVFALAAGNDGRLKEAFPEVLAVSALADFDGVGGGLGSPTCRSDQDDSLADFSNFGPEVDIAAPGVCILSTWNDGSVNTISGTSMASPHVAGSVALYLFANGLSPATDAGGVDAIEDAILQAALAQSDPCGYTNEHAGEGSDEPLLFVNAAAFGGDGSCDDGSGGGDGTTNSPPSASFEFVCTDLTCDFDGTLSSDSDGTIQSYDWDFGDGNTGTGSTVTHTYGAGGTFTVTLTVTDDGGATDSQSQDVAVSESTSDGISLSASGRKVRGLHTVDLTWSGATTDLVDIFLSIDGGTFEAVIVDTPNDGAETHETTNRGSGTYTYKLCENDSSVCSNEASVVF